jgi:hypothetical protein
MEQNQETSEESKMRFALIQIDILFNLLMNNENKDSMYQHLTDIQVEIERQLSHYGKKTN